MKKEFYNIITNNPDFSPLFRLISKYIEGKYKFLKPIFYDDYMVFSDTLNNCPIIVTTDKRKKRLIIISKYNNFNMIVQPNTIFKATSLIDNAIRSYNYHKSVTKLDKNFVDKDNHKAITRNTNQGTAAIYNRRDNKGRKYK